MGATLSRNSTTRDGNISHGLVWERDADILQHYALGSKLGQGSMGEVWTVSRKQKSVRISNKSAVVGTERKFAMKTIHTNRISKSMKQEIKNEVQMLKELDHPNIIRLFEVFTHRRKMYLLMECCTGGDLGTRHYTEYQVAYVMKQILQGLSHMHHLSICHRDLKMENILFESEDSWNVKLIDFGLSMKYIRGKCLKKACGTVYTVAPEVIYANGYTSKADMWSVGVIAYILLSRTFPFLAKETDLQDKDKMEKFLEAKVVLSGPEWSHISQQGKNFVLGLLRKKPLSRWSASETLSYVTRDWIPIFSNPQNNQSTNIKNDPYNEENKDDQKIINESNKIDLSNESNTNCQCGQDTTEICQKRGSFTNIVNSIQAFSEYGELKRTALILIASLMDRTQIDWLREVFLEMDTTQNGIISFNELRDAMQKLELDDAVVQRAFNSMDLRHCGKIKYMEFIAATLEARGFIEEERLMEAFDRLDTESTGYISCKDLKKVVGVECVKRRFKKMSSQVDPNNEKICFEEFMEMFSNSIKIIKSDSIEIEKCLEII